jgi:hypothetical protein
MSARSAWLWTIIALLTIAAMVIGAIGGGTYKVTTTFARDKSVSFEAHPRVPLLAAIAQAIKPIESNTDDFLVLGPFPNSSSLFAQITSAVNDQCAPSSVSDVHTYSYQERKSQADYAVVVFCKRGDPGTKSVKFQYRCKIDPTSVDIQILEQSKDDAIELLSYSGVHNGLYWIERQDLSHALVPGAAACTQH